MFETTIAGSLPKPSWLAEPRKLWPQWKLAGEALAEAKRDATLLNDGEAHNMGRDEVIGHDLRYDRADEFLEIVLGHWDAWEDDAIVQDKASGLFAHPDKVHRCQGGQIQRGSLSIRFPSFAPASGGSPG